MPVRGRVLGRDGLLSDGYFTRLKRGREKALGESAKSEKIRPKSARVEHFLA